MNGRSLGENGLRPCALIWLLRVLSESSRRMISARLRSRRLCRYGWFVVGAPQITRLHPCDVRPIRSLGIDHRLFPHRTFDNFALAIKNADILSGPIRPVSRRKKPVHRDGLNDCTELLEESHVAKYQRTLAPHSLRHDHRYIWTHDKSPDTSGTDV